MRRLHWSIFSLSEWNQNAVAVFMLEAVWWEKNPNTKRELVQAVCVWVWVFIACAWVLMWVILPVKKMSPSPLEKPKGFNQLNEFTETTLWTISSPFMRHDFHSPLFFLVFTRGWQHLRTIVKFKMTFCQIASKFRNTGQCGGNQEGTEALRKREPDKAGGVSMKSEKVPSNSVMSS